MGQYPRLVINTQKLYENTVTVKNRCGEKGIALAAIVKGFNGIPEAVDYLNRAKPAQLGTSRIEQIKSLKEWGIKGEYLLIRIPMLSEAADVAEYADMSLESEISVIEAVNEEALKRGKVHDIILMADIGDLREGFWDWEEMAKAAIYIENSLHGINLRGIGTNIGCYGSVKATPEKMNELIGIAEYIEGKLGRRLEYISGGATSSYEMVLNDTMPERINHLRIGEEIITPKAFEELPDWGLQDMKLDVFTYEAEVIEVKVKPSYPVGELSVDCFGNVAVYEDRGMMRRAVLGTGRLDHMSFERLVPFEAGMRLLGDSSDHLLADINECREIEPGDVMRFGMEYASVLFTSGCDFVKKIVL